jgi:hypothetical protein
VHRFAPLVSSECDAAIKCVRCSYLADADPITEDMKKCLPDAENTPVVTCANDEDVCTVTISCKYICTRTAMDAFQLNYVTRYV